MNTCDCNKPKHGESFPPAVLELVQKEAPVLFHKTTFPASIGDETTNPPDTLNYRNVLLTYEATGMSYLYSSDGIPTFISMGAQDLSRIEQELEKMGVQIVEMGNEISELQSGLTEAETNIKNVEDGLTELQSDIAKEAVARADADDAIKVQMEQTDQALAQSITTAQGDIAVLQEDLDTVDAELKATQAQTVQFDTTVTGNGSTVTLTKSQGNLAGGTPTTTAMPLPVASATDAGIMNPATFNAVQTNSEDINSILNGAVAVASLPAAPTQEELTEQWKTATGLATLINRASIFDVDNQKLWYYYTNAGEWYSVNNTPEVTVSQFTNSMAGIIKGSEQPGQIFAEADGTGSVVGWDGVKHDIENLVELVEGLQVPKLYTSYSTATDGANTAAFINSKLNSGNLVLGSQAVSISTAGYNVILGNSASGRGTPGNGCVIVGGGAIAGGAGAIAIGYSAGNSKAIGNPNVIAIGNSAKSWGAYSVVLGYGAYVNTSQEYSVAIGTNSHTTRSNEVSFGSGTDSTGPATRLLANMSDGVLDTDGVNLRQLKQSKNRAWQANTAYGAGELVTNEGKLYTVSSAFTSGDEFDSTNLAEILGGGGGGGAILYSSYSTATDGANTANFINGKLNNTSIVLGQDALYKTATSSGSANDIVVIGREAIGLDSNTNGWGMISIGRSATSTGTRAVTIGQYARGGSNSVAIGGGENTTLGKYTSAGSSSIAIGAKANAATSESVAVGTSATIGNGATSSVALGTNSATSRSYELSIGSGSGSTPTRFLANVTAGELDADAVNKKQMEDYVATHAGIGEITYGADTVTLGSTELTAAQGTQGGAVGKAGIMSSFQATQLAALATAYEAEEKGTTLYSGTASVNNVTLSESGLSYDHLIVVAEYMGMGSSALKQQVSAVFYPTNEVKAFQMTATDITVGDAPAQTTIQDIWMISEDGLELDLASSVRTQITKNGTLDLEVTPETTSMFTITKVIGFGKKI